MTVDGIGALTRVFGELFNDSVRRRFTCGQPKDNQRLAADWSRRGGGAHSCA